MNKNLLILGGLTLSTASLLAAATIGVKANDPICQMQTNDGRSTDLSAICGKGNTEPASSLGQIDPNAPVVSPLVKSDKPSELWNTLPDLPTPPQQGTTVPQSDQPDAPMPAADPSP